MISLEAQALFEIRQDVAMTKKALLSLNSAAAYENVGGCAILVMLGQNVCFRSMVVNW